MFLRRKAVSGRGPLLGYVLSLLLFGSNGIVARQIALGSVDIVFYRTMIGSLFLLAIFRLSGGRFRFRSIRKKHLLLVLGSGVSMGLSWLLLYEAYSRLGVGAASLLYYTGPVFVVLLSPLLFRERLTARKLLCFGLVLLGMLLTERKQLQGGGEWIGLACGIGSAVLYALMVILNKKAESVTGMKNAAIQLCASFLTVALFLALSGGTELPTPGGGLLWLLVLGLVNTGLGCALYFSSIGRLPVQTVSVLGYVEPLSALLLSVLILGESLDALQGLGAALILAGALLIGGKWAKGTNKG